MDYVDKCSTEYGFQSDHSAVVLDLKVSNRKRGPGFWKFNTMLIYDVQYVNELKSK